MKTTKKSKSKSSKKSVKAVKAIKRTFDVDILFKSATGFVGKTYVGWTADALLEITGSESTMAIMNGNVLVSGKIVQIYDKNGKKVTIPYKSSFENKSAELVNGTVKISFENKYSSVNVLVEASKNGTVLDGTLTAIIKGTWAMLANDILLTATGKQKGEDVQVEETIPDPENPSEPDPETPSQPTGFIDATKPFSGYGLVNNWSAQDPVKFINLLSSYKIPCMAFEFFEWGSPEKFAKVDELITKFKKYIDASQSKKIILYVTLLNSNLGSGKYGDAGITADKYDKSIKKAAAQLANWMKVYKNIYVTPVGEGGSQTKTKAYDKKLQDLCKATMPKDKLVNNWGARPTSTDGMAFLCQHPSSVSASFNSKSWIMSDHGLFIRELNGGDLYGTANYDVTYKCAKGLKDRSKTFIYYHFDKNGKIDETAMKAIKAAFSSSVTPGPTPDPDPGTGDTIKPSQVKWLTSRGPDYKNAKTVINITSASMSGTHLNFKTNKSIPWPKRGAKNVNAIGILIRKNGAGYTGGKTEWCVGDRGWFDIKTNTADGYNGHTIPSKGEKCWCALGDPDGGDEISTIVPFIWN